MADPANASRPAEASAKRTKPSVENPALFRCQEPGCTRKFTRKYTLNEHIKTHTGEKTHVCPVRTCGKRFTTSGNLSRHKRLHDFIEPIRCPVVGCICTFPSEGKLEKHMRFHLGTSVQVCEVPGCGKTFSTTGNLNRHMKHQHEDVDFLPATMTTLTKQSPTTADAWQPERILGDETHRENTRWINRAASVAANPPQLDQEQVLTAEDIERVGRNGDLLEKLSSLLGESHEGNSTVTTAGDVSGSSLGQSEENIFDSIIRFHVEELGYLANEDHAT